jgi:DNA helicase TIP49 (TBP-interacting protein)
VKNLIIRSTDWEEEAPIEFDIKNINIQQGFEFPFTLTNPENGEKEVYPIANTMVVTLEGEDDQMSVVISESLLHEFDKDEFVEMDKMVIDLHPGKTVYELGMSVGLYFDIEDLPKELRSFKIRLPEGE